MFFRLRVSSFSPLAAATLAAMVAGTSLLGCSSDESEPADNGTSGTAGTNSASFDITGTWTGNAVDSNTDLAVTVIFDNNGGPNGQTLAGTLKIAGVDDLKFTAGFSDPREGAARTTFFEASDNAGYIYKLNGTLSAKRMDDAQLTTTNPAVGADEVYLKTTLVKQ